ncbi:MAG: hypothetical protein RMJ07_00775 [Nitrososphaerota archaeon]|nr:hypothetical protein [Candidatus Bathyarchaeota archaeon]MDW8048206.1 hypothetical protein [Nitrososphaerota archaeon]
MKNRPACFKCGAYVTSFTYMDYPLGPSLLMMVFCKECGAVQGMVLKEK